MFLFKEEFIMKAKKLLAMTVGMVMCGAMFAGCGDTGSGSGSTGGDAKPADTTAAADKPAEDRKSVV